jgi:tRNA-uridine 2-sulfurtransferase
MGEDVRREETSARRVVCAFSGGLDSILAAVHMERLGFDVLLLHVQHLFSADEQGRERIRRTADYLGLPLRVEDVSAEHLETVRRPVHGYGKGMNPCVDCRIFMLKVAKRVMEAEGAEFIVTGEVLGQRPKSQQLKALMQAAEESGLGDRLVRPLSARHLPETWPVKLGWIREGDLLAFHGRSRQEQMALAAQYGILEYPQPAGGCILIEPTYAARVRDAFRHLGRDEVGVLQFRLFRYGRQFRLSETVKVIVGRHQAENEALTALAGDRMRVDPVDVMGPTSLIEGTPTEDELVLCFRLCARYCDHAPGDRVCMQGIRGDTERVISVDPLPADDPRIAAWRIG